MKKVRITVLKTTLDEELAAEYGAEGLGPCPMLREGQVLAALSSRSFRNRVASSMKICARGLVHLQ